MENITPLRSKWNNLFRYEHASGDDQRENNVTKSLLKVIQDSNQEISRSVLCSLVKGVDGVDFRIKDFSTQIGLNTAQDRAKDLEFELVGISRYEGSDAMDTANELVEQNESVGEAGVVDAVITVELENQIKTIIFEIKTQSEPLDPEQLAKYQSQLCIPRENCYTLTWPQVYNTFQAELNELDPDAFPLTTYLFDEFTEFLAVEELEGVVAEKAEGATKRLLVRRKHDVADSEADRYGELEIRIEWADGGTNSSTVGWIAAETLQEIIQDMDSGLREAFREADGKLLRNYLQGDATDWSPTQDNLTYLAEATPKNDDNDDAILRLVAAAEHTNPQLRIARYVGTTYDRYTTPPYLTLGDNQDEFTLLLNDIPAHVREEVFTHQPDLEQLWQEYLRSGEQGDWPTK
jgi:hypothetical protein